MWWSKHYLLCGGVHSLLYTKHCVRTCSGHTLLLPFDSGVDAVGQHYSSTQDAWYRRRDGWMLDEQHLQFKHPLHCINTLAWVPTKRWANHQQAAGVTANLDVSNLQRGTPSLEFGYSCMIVQVCRHTRVYGACHRFSNGAHWMYWTALHLWMCETVLFQFVPAFHSVKPP